MDEILKVQTRLSVIIYKLIFLFITMPLYVILAHFFSDFCGILDESLKNSVNISFCVAFFVIYTPRVFIYTLKVVRINFPKIDKYFNFDYLKTSEIQRSGNQFFCFYLKLYRKIILKILLCISIPVFVYFLVFNSTSDNLKTIYLYMVLISYLSLIISLMIGINKNDLNVFVLLIILISVVNIAYKYYINSGYSNLVGKIMQIVYPAVDIYEKLAIQYILNFLKQHLF